MPDGIKRRERLDVCVVQYLGMTTVHLDVRRFSFSHGSKVVLREVSFEVSKHSLTGLVGPNGCGKSTLIYVLAGLYPRFHGEILYEGHPLSPLDRTRMGFLFDAPFLQPDVPLYAQLAYAKSLVRRLPASGEESQKLVEFFEIAPLLKKRGAELSHGERQRWSLLMALLKSPDFLVLDEPTDGLDQSLQNKLFQFLKDQIKRKRLSALMVTHHPEDLPKPHQIVDLSI